MTSPDTRPLTPRTAAGRALLDYLERIERGSQDTSFPYALGDILDIEKEAAERAPREGDGRNNSVNPSRDGLREAARAFIDHVAEAAAWPTPGIGCYADCEFAHDLRAALAPATLADRVDDPLLSEDEGETAIDRRARLRGEGL